MRRRKPAKVVSLNEAGEVKALCDWLDAKGIGYIPIPNKGRWHAGQDLRRKGAPDLVLTRTSKGLPVAVEMKRTNASPSDTKAEQLAVHEEMRNGGWVVIVARGATDAIERLTGMGF